MPRPADVGVGTAVFLIRSAQSGRAETLLGRRFGAHGAGEWSLPGGWIDRADGTIEFAAAREIEEETGLVVRSADLRLVCAMKKDYPDFATITLFYAARVPHDGMGGVVSREPAKCAGWVWFDLDDLPRPLFNAIDAAAEQLRARPVAEARGAVGYSI